MHPKGWETQLNFPTVQTIVATTHLRFEMVRFELLRLPLQFEMLRLQLRFGGDIDVAITIAI